jgi:hypothetical protein
MMAFRTETERQGCTREPARLLHSQFPPESAAQGLAQTPDPQKEVRQAVRSFYDAFNAHTFENAETYTTEDWNHINRLVAGLAAASSWGVFGCSSRMKGIPSSPVLRGLGASNGIGRLDSYPKPSGKSDHCRANHPRHGINLQRPSSALP